MSHAIHAWYIYLRLVDSFYGKCREIHHTWRSWVWFVHLQPTLLTSQTWLYKENNPTNSCNTAQEQGLLYVTLTNQENKMILYTMILYHFDTPIAATFKHLPKKDMNVTLIARPPKRNNFICNTGGQWFFCHLNACHTEWPPPVPFFCHNLPLKLYPI